MTLIYNSVVVIDIVTHLKEKCKRVVIVSVVVGVIVTAALFVTVLLPRFALMAMVKSTTPDSMLSRVQIFQTAN